MTEELKQEQPIIEEEENSLGDNPLPPSSTQAEPPLTISPPPTPQLGRERQYSHHSSNISHSSIHQILNSDNDNRINRILNIQLDSDEKDEQDLAEFCNKIITRKFKESVKTNNILTSKGDSKNFNIKLYKDSDIDNIKQTIINAVDNPDEKIVNFVNNSVDLLLLSNFYSRSIASLVDNTFHRISLTSKYKSKWFKQNFFLINIKISSINFL